MKLWKRLHVWNQSICIPTSNLGEIGVSMHANGTLILIKLIVSESNPNTTYLLFMWDSLFSHVDHPYTECVRDVSGTEITITIHI